MYILLCLDVYRMANEALEEIFQTLQRDIIAVVSPDSVMDALLSKEVISTDDYDRLCRVPVPRDRCRDMLSLLHNSSNPEAFIHLRLVLIDIDEYPGIVERIDKKLSLVFFQGRQKILKECGDDENAREISDYGKFIIFLLLILLMLVLVLVFVLKDS